jgi:lysosomal Pro-X carboxypeptidase
MLTLILISSVRGIHPNHKGSEQIENCELHWFKVPLDHFTHTVPHDTFEIRYYFCRNTRQTKTLFVYFGNEADVGLYLRNTGLMWESADRHGASLVFLEHRYYGKSKPFTKLDKSNMGYLSTSQAMADYAAILTHLTSSDYKDIPVIGFGGSYGGMIATYFRLKYPYLVDGVIAASAPIWTYYGEGYDWNSFAKIVTNDAEMASRSCVVKARKAWKIMFHMGISSKGRSELEKAVKLCSPLETYQDVERLVDWMSEAWDYMAMGNFPYQSSYLVDGLGRLPAYPVRKACSFLTETDGIELVKSMAKAIGVYYNASDEVKCYQYNTDSSSETEDFWNYQYCTEHFMPMERDGIHDMFYPKPFNLSHEIQECKDRWDVEPDLHRGITEFGGKKILDYLSNAVFSNGALDPWSGGGVLHIPAWLEKKNNLRTIMIPEGAHHLDLMFSNEDDPLSVLDARRIENEMIASWIEQKAAHVPSTSDPGNQHSIQ